MLFSLLLSLCISSGSMLICEDEVKLENLTQYECMDEMDSLMREIHRSPFYAFEWVVQCVPKE